MKMVNYQEIVHKLQSKTVKLGGKDCQVWTGARDTYKPDVLAYGKILNPFRKLDNQPQYIRVHKLMFLAMNEKTYMNNGTGNDQYDVSHVCHNSLCINYHHLSREPHWVNNGRKECVSQGHCLGHDIFPDCVF